MNEWDRARRRQDQLREQAAKRQVSLRRLREQTLAPGWTWNQVLSWHNFSWSVALAYWDECRRLEHQYPGYRYWEPRPNNPMAWPTQAPAAAPSPPPMSPPPPGGRLRRGRERKTAGEQKPSAPMDERNERILGWSEGQRAWEVWHEGISQSEPDEPDDDDTAGENSSR